MRLWGGAVWVGRERRGGQEWYQSRVVICRKGVHWLCATVIEMPRRAGARTDVREAVLEGAHAARCGADAVADERVCRHPRHPRPPLGPVLEGVHPFPVEALELLPQAADAKDDGDEGEGAERGGGARVGVADEDADGEGADDGGADDGPEDEADEEVLGRKGGGEGV